MATLENVAAHQRWPLRGVPLYYRLSLSHLRVQVVLIKCGQDPANATIASKDNHTELFKSFPHYCDKEHIFSNKQLMGVESQHDSYHKSDCRKTGCGVSYYKRSNHGWRWNYM